MPYSYDITGSKSSGDTIVVPFPHLDRDHVTIEVDDVEVSSSLWSWLTDGTISALEDFPSGTETRVKRTTPIDGLEGVLNGATSFDYRSVNANFTQLLYVLQERLDKEVEEASDTIADGSVGYSKTSEGVQASLDKADSAIQADDLHAVATSGSYNDLTDKPTAAAIDGTAYSAAWNGETDAPTKNAVYDELEVLRSAVLSSANNLSDLANAGTARGNLGLTIGTHVQAFQAPQLTAVWETGTGTTESTITPAKLAAAIGALAAGGGDMLKSTYDPNTIGGDAFSMGTMVETDDEKIFTTTERDKLAGIASGATANSANATLLSRSNHTGSQLASTISDFSTAADARITASLGSTVQAYDAATGKTDVAQQWTLQSSAVETLTDGATITPTGTKNLNQVTLGGNRAMANPTAITAGAGYLFKIEQDGTGSRTLSWGSAYKFPGSTAITLSTDPDAVDVVAGYSFDGVTIQMLTPGQDFG